MKILVVVDMQNDFVDGSLGTAEAVKIVPKVIEKIKKFSGQVVYTKDTHEKNYLETQEGKKLPVEHCIRNTKGWDIYKDVYIGENPIIEKNTFGSLGLVKYINDKINSGEIIESIEFIGLCTDICVVTNSLLVKTNFPEIPLIVDSNCCAGVTVDSHNSALETLKMCQVEVV